MNIYTKFAICICAGISLVSCQNASAAQIVLEWDPPATQTDQTVVTNLTGYKVYYGTESGSYDHVLEVSTAPQITVSGLQSGQRYFFAVAALTSDNTEGILSDEVVWDAPAPNANPNLSLSITPPSAGLPPSFVLKWTGQAGKTYAIEASSDLLSWQPAANGESAVEQSTQTALSDGTLTYCDTDATSAKQRFYRITISS